MSKNLDRRSFIKKSATISAATIVGGGIAASTIQCTRDKTDISIVKGANYFSNTLKAVELLGGIKKFVSKGSRVGLLINVEFDKPGTYVKPEIALAVMRMCYDAGVDRIYCLRGAERSYWNKSSLSKEYKEQIRSLINIYESHTHAVYDEKYFVKAKIPQGVILKEAEVVKALYECDVLINIAISKHHSSSSYTGLLKNTMGLCTRKTNLIFHKGVHVNKRFDNDPMHLAQCIADLNLLRKPELCILDSTEFIITNGPVGPGEIVKLQKVLAGTDIVATDSKFTSFKEWKIKEIPSITKAYELGIGEIDFNKLNIKEAAI